MTRIENFAALSTEQQANFAKDLLSYINKEGIFSSETIFNFIKAEVNDLSGELEIEASHTEPVSVARNATWTCSDIDDVEFDINDSDIEYEQSLTDDLNKALKTFFKTFSTIIEGYEVTVQVHDWDELDEERDIEAKHITHEDSGIGSYDYFGFSGVDSNPYIEAEGVITTKCDCALVFFVAPADGQ